MTSLALFIAERLTTELYVAIYGDHNRMPVDELAAVIASAIAEHEKANTGQPQYRMMKAGEVIQDGDEFLDVDYGGHWKPTVSAGTLVPPIQNYRRKITPADPTKEKS